MYFFFSFFSFCNARRQNFRSGRFNFHRRRRRDSSTRRGFHRAKLIFGNASFEELPEHTRRYFPPVPLFPVSSPPRELPPHNPPSLPLPLAFSRVVEIGQTINTRVFLLNSKWRQALLFFRSRENLIIRINVRY